MNRRRKQASKPKRLTYPRTAPLERAFRARKPAAPPGSSSRSRAESSSAVDTETDGTPGASFYGKGTGGRSRLVVDRGAGTIVGATFTGFETADFLHAATIAIVGEVPLTKLRHAVAAYPSRSEVWLKLLEAYGL